MKSKSILAGLGGVEPMAQGHLGISLHVGVRPEELTALLDLVSYQIGEAQVKPLRSILSTLVAARH